MGYTRAPAATARWLMTSLPVVVMMVYLRSPVWSQETTAAVVFRHNKRALEGTGEEMSKRQAAEHDPLRWLRTSLDGVPISTMPANLASGPHELVFEGPEALQVRSAGSVEHTTTASGTTTTREYLRHVCKPVLPGPDPTPTGPAMLRFEAQPGHVYEVGWDFDWPLSIGCPAFEFWIKDKEAKGKEKKRKGKFAQAKLELW